MRAEFEARMRTLPDLAARIRLVIESGRVENASTWSKDAGLTRQFINTFLARWDAGEAPDIGLRTMERLADAARVSRVWFALGLESPDAKDWELVALNARSFVVIAAQPDFKNADLVELTGRAFTVGRAFVAAADVRRRQAAQEAADVAVVSTLAERIEEVLEVRGLTMSGWGKKAGASRSIVEHLRSGRRGTNPSLGGLKALASAAQVRWQWLADGSGPRDLAAVDGGDR